MFNIRRRETAQLRRVELVAPRSVIGKNTAESLHAGIVYGFAGQVDTILRRMRAEMGECETIATGGLSEHIVPFCEEVDTVDDLLTLNGLRLLYERNR